MMHEPKTLGDVLAPAKQVNSPNRVGMWAKNTALFLLNLAMLTVIFALPVWWLLVRPDIDINVMLAILVVLAIVWFIAVHRFQATKSPTKGSRRTLHFLLADDRQGFMRDLRLDAKTAIFDGSNIHHFGHANGLDAQPLGHLAYQLRAEGYRIVCFFDANIYYTLSEHGAFPRSQDHNIQLLTDIFGLERNEIFVVRSGVQADKYVLESLKHLPNSFAVTNDRFRDYAKEYAAVMKEPQWRRGVMISKNTVKLR